MFPLRIFTEPQQGASYEAQRAMAQEAEALGFDAFFRSDHYRAIGFVGGGSDSQALPGPTDSWVTLGALARETSRIRLGTLVTSATFRLPGPLAIAVAQVDAMSGGRVEFGIGAGWYEVEHTAYGIPFPPVGERFDRLEEQLAVITGLWATPAGERFSFEGRHYRLTDCPALPKPVQRPGPPVILGGTGPRRTPALAARYAAEANVPFSSPAVFAEAVKRFQEACQGHGRDPATLVYSAAVTVCCGAGESEYRRRAAAIGRDPDELRETSAAGTPAEVVTRLAAYRDAGASRLYLQVLDLEDLDHLRLVAAEVAPHL